MWMLREIEPRPTELDLSSSEQGIFRGHALIADGVLFANALELTSWDADKFQLSVCESCGYESCAPGDWLCLRRIGDHVVFAPVPEAYGGDERDLSCTWRPLAFRAGTPCLHFEPGLSAVLRD